jgi:hypothetical protein
MLEMQPEFRHGNNLDFKFVAELDLLMVLIERALQASVKELYG